jgi:hypothetical protein
MKNMQPTANRCGWLDHRQKRGRGVAYQLLTSYVFWREIGSKYQLRGRRITTKLKKRLDLFMTSDFQPGDLHAGRRKRWKQEAFREPSLSPLALLLSQ